MYMTEDQKYNAVIKELGELLQSKNTTISIQRWQLDELKEKLAAAEEERDFAKEKLADAGVKISILLKDVEELKEKLAAAEEERDEAKACAAQVAEQLVNAHKEIEKLQGGAV